MPREDGTGPEGKGPMTGKESGCCNSEKGKGHKFTDSKCEDGHHGHHGHHGGHGHHKGHGFHKGHGRKGCCGSVEYSVNSKKLHIETEISMLRDEIAALEKVSRDSKD